MANEVTLYVGRNGRMDCLVVDGKRFKYPNPNSIRPQVFRRLLAFWKATGLLVPGVRVKVVREVQTESEETYSFFSELP